MINSVVERPLELCQEDWAVCVYYWADAGQCADSVCLLLQYLDDDVFMQVFLVISVVCVHYCRTSGEQKSPFQALSVLAIKLHLATANQVPGGFRVHTPEL